MNQEPSPQFLYKVLTMEHWDMSQAQGALVLSQGDEAFIHLSREDQVGRITGKYWAHVPEYVILKLDVSSLQGRLVFEANPGGENKYYHLYDGAIPLNAVVDVQIMRQQVKSDV
jgi:uncharacterized protein (DUF952 family)